MILTNLIPSENSSRVTIKLRKLEIRKFINQVQSKLTQSSMMNFQLTFFVLRTLQHNQSTSSLYGTDVVCEEHRTLIDSISRQIVYDCAAATSVMSTNALAFLLLNLLRSGVLETDIAKELDALRSVLKGRRDMGFSGESLHVVRYACDLLEPGMLI